MSEKVDRMKKIEELLDINRSTLDQLERQIALHGGDMTAPVDKLTHRSMIQAEIEQREKELRSLRENEDETVPRGRTKVYHVHESVPIEYIVDFESEMELFERIISLQHPTRIVRFTSHPKRGKTSLLRKFKHFCQQTRHPCCFVSFEVERYRNPHYSLAKRVSEDLGLAFSLSPSTGQDASSGFPDCANPLVREYLEEQFHRKMSEFLTAISPNAVVILIDAFENVVTESDTWFWLLDHLLRPIEKGIYKNLVIVVAGRETFYFDDEPDWRTLYPDSLVLARLSLEDVIVLASVMGVILSEETIRKIYEKHKGYPQHTSMALQNIKLTMEVACGA